jgi:hypothetical protein
MHDPVNPKHYAELGEYSALHVSEKWGLNYLLGTAIKYIQRAGKKPDTPAIVDLKKARWYIQRQLYILDPENEADPAADENRNGYTVR